jgi:hypothetical protein
MIDFRQLPRKWNVPLTYEPKIEPVKQGTIRQTIRIGRKYSVGDLIRFYVWEGKPYRSKRHNITDYQVNQESLDIRIFPDGFVREHLMDCDGQIISWDTNDAQSLAVLDGIIPPTGEALREVLIAKNGKIPSEGIEAQIIRW